MRRRLLEIQPAPNDGDSATVEKLKRFVSDMEQIRQELPHVTAYDAACSIDQKFAIIANMRSDTSLEGQSRLENVAELFNSIKEFVEDGQKEYESMAAEGYQVPLVTLDMYLENVSLISDLDTGDDEQDRNKVSLMTVHSSKGLEFEYVYIVGMEENLFPSSSGFISEEELEEERRLFYVALTRAQKGVKLSFAHSRMKWGSHVNNSPSRFIKEIDGRYILNPLTDFQTLSGQASRGAEPSAIFSRRPSPVRRVAAASGNADGFKASPSDKIAAGQMVEHSVFGIGKVVSVDGDPLSRKAVVDFQECGRKTLLLKFAKIRILE